MKEVECKMCGDLGNWSERDGYPTCDECHTEQDVEARRKEAYETECPACRDFWDKPTDLVCSQCGR